MDCKRWWDRRRKRKSFHENRGWFFKTGYGVYRKRQANPVFISGVGEWRSVGVCCQCIEPEHKLKSAACDFKNAADRIDLSRCFHWWVRCGGWFDRCSLLCNQYGINSDWWIDCKDSIGRWYGGWKDDIADRSAGRDGIRHGIHGFVGCDESADCIRVCLCKRTDRPHKESGVRFCW